MTCELFVHKNKKIAEKMSALLLLVFLIQAPNSPCEIIGKLPIRGIEHDLFVGTSDPRFIKMEDNGFTLLGGGNLSLFRTPIEDFSLNLAWPVRRIYFQIQFAQSFFSLLFRFLLEKNTLVTRLI